MKGRIFRNHIILFYSGDCRSLKLSFREQLSSLSSEETSPLILVLVPKDADLSKIKGDDWDDAPAVHNAGSPYVETLPKGSVIIYGELGKELKVVEL